MLFVAFTGLEAFAEILATHYSSFRATIHLFKNDYNPSFSTLLTDLVEATFVGYAPFTILDWFEPGFVGQVTYIQAVDASSWLTTSASFPPELVYGYYILDGSGQLLWAERDVNGPIDMTSSGNRYTIFARLGLSNCPP